MRLPSDISREFVTGTKSSNNNVPPSQLLTRFFVRDFEDGIFASDVEFAASSFPSGDVAVRFSIKKFDGTQEEYCTIAQRKHTIHCELSCLRSHAIAFLLRSRSRCLVTRAFVKGSLLQAFGMGH